MFEKIIKRKLLNQLSSVNYGSIKVEFPDKRIIVFMGKETGVSADISIGDWKVITQLISRGDVGFAEAYRDGYWSSSNLENLLLFALHNEHILNNFGSGSFIFKQLSKLLYFKQRNTRKGSKRNIQAHYDLGNNFYTLWLDKTMTYSAAIFNHARENLEVAQVNKYTRLLDKIDKPQANILEVGCGWGGFAELAGARGHKVKGVTLSEEQYLYAKERTQNLDVTIALEDYRDQQGKYDAIVSIEMFEAVGEEYWDTYFAKLHNLISDAGKILLQIITIDDSIFDEYRKNADVIRTFIFPGGMLPCERELNKKITANKLQVDEIYRFGGDYAKTLRLWLQEFDDNIANVKAQGFDEEFIRLWRFYLAFCSAGFEHGRLNVIHLELSKA